MISSGESVIYVTLEGEFEVASLPLYLRVSRSSGSRSTDVSIGASLSTPDSMTKKFYELAPGYIEAEDLCRDIHHKLLHLVIDVFKFLREREFTHLA